MIRRNELREHSAYGACRPSGLSRLKAATCKASTLKGCRVKAWRASWAAVADVFTAVPAGVAPIRLPRPIPLLDDEQSSFSTRLGNHLLRRRGRIVVACLATVLGPAVVAQAGAIDTRPTADVQVAPAGNTATSPATPAPVPGDRDSWLILARRAAATCPGLPSAVLAAMASVETGMGVLTTTSPAGAAGPMQFLPATWAAYGTDGDGDGVVDVLNPADAMHAAARLLCANGGADPTRLPSAIWNYNHSDDYVRQVMLLARFTGN